VARQFAANTRRFIIEQRNRMKDDPTDESPNPEHQSGPRELTLLEAFDLLVASIPPENRHRRELYILRSQIEAQ
jgi:hypothetical protein